MQLTGPGVWGPPADRGAALRTLKCLRDLGVNFVDTADSYGPNYAEELVREALHPYGDIVVATKASRDPIIGCPWDGLNISFSRPTPVHGDLTRAGSRLGAIAKKPNATPSQIALAWLLRISPVVVPIPGTSNVAHLEQNVAASRIELTAQELAELEGASADHSPSL